MPFSYSWRVSRLALLSILSSSSFGSAQQEATPTKSSVGTAPPASTTFSGEASTTSAASGTHSGSITHTVAVAKVCSYMLIDCVAFMMASDGKADRHKQGGFTFVPDVIQAAVGDTIGMSCNQHCRQALKLRKLICPEYDFYPTNHSVVRAEYGYPCIPYELTGVDKVGFFSGFKQVDAILQDPPKFSVRINDTNPIFYYCSAPGSCINYAMVGVINPNSTVSLATQKQKAQNSTFMLQPGEDWPSESGPDPFPTTTAGSSGATQSSTNSSAPAGTTSAAAAHSSGLSSGAIAGIAIGAYLYPAHTDCPATSEYTLIKNVSTGAAAVALIAASLLWLCGRHSRSPRHVSQAQYPQPVSQVPPTIPNKHLSGATMSDAQHPYSTYVPSGALPGYHGYSPYHDPNAANRMPVYSYAASDALSPASEHTEPPGSPDPIDMRRQSGVVPAYASTPPPPQLAQPIYPS